MSQSQYPTIRIYSKDSNVAPTGANTVVELNGEKLTTASFVKVEFHARRVTKVLIELYAHVEVDTIGELTTRVLELKPSAFESSVKQMARSK